VGLPEGQAGSERRPGPQRTEPPIVPAKIRIPVAPALPRERLAAVLEQAWRHRLVVVAAPAGSGKTTLLAGFAAVARVPVAWYRAETWDADERTFLAYLERALTGALPGLAGGWASVEDAAAALERWDGGRAALIVDDVHTLEGTLAEAALGRFVDYAPPWLAILWGTRVVPSFNLSRLRVSGGLLEIGPDELRFRAWEVERLFAHFYHDPVPPADLAVLARRTEGWAAGLQLFHLATRGKSPEERRRVLASAGSSGRLLREYLARNVLAELPDELRAFLVETSVLRRLTGAMCDELLARQGSGTVLQELAHRQIFTVALDEEDGSFRYHEILRAHLDRVLVELVGEDEARARHARAGRLLEAADAHQEALAAYCRAEDWTAVRRLLGGQGERLAGQASGWVDALPPAVVRHDPWLLLAAARGARADGRWTAALALYAQAEAAFGASSAAVMPGRERQALLAWLDPVAIPPGDWTGVLRSGLVREPVSAGRELRTADPATTALVRGLLALVAGNVAEARDGLNGVAGTGDLGPILSLVARLGAGVAAMLAGDTTGRVVVEEAALGAERLGMPWLARLALTASRLDRRPRATEEALPNAEDPIGMAMGALVRGWAADAIPVTGGGGRDGLDPAERRLADAELAATTFRRLGLGVPEAWARALAAYARAELGEAEARDAAAAAESFARATGTTGPRLVAYAAMALADPARAQDYELLVDAVHRETGLHPPQPSRWAARTVVAPGSSPAGDEPAASPRTQAGDPTHGSVDGASDPGVPHALLAAGSVMPSFQVRTLGGFALHVGDTRVAIDRVKPRPRAVLRLLALHGGAPVHREVICEALWPEADAQTGARSLHVAISALRGLLAETAGVAGAQLVAREGDAYRLAVAPDAIDLRRFEQAMTQGRAARRRGESSAAAFGAALDLYTGDLLPEDGPADWVVERREGYRAEAAEAARSIAEEALLAGRLDEAVRAARRGLAIDRAYDPLWRLLIEGRERAGDTAAARRERREYELVLADLALPGRAPVAS
jgi:serine/threonine-protein kinase PknK